MRIRVASLLVNLILLSGCSREDTGLHAVKGKVLHEGQPAAGAMIIFNPKSGEMGSKNRPSAIVADDGSFELSTRGKADGAPPGEYLVSVIWLSNGAGEEGGIGLASPRQKAGGPDRLGRRYSDPARSGLTATIVEGENQLPPFELK